MIRVVSPRPPSAVQLRGCGGTVASSSSACPSFRGSGSRVAATSGRRKRRSAISCCSSEDREGARGAAPPTPAPTAAPSDGSIQLYSQIERVITEAAKQSSEGWGSTGDWTEIEGAWVLRPKSTEPSFVVHFIGGIFVGAAPQVTYRFFLERLAEKGALVIATPYASGFDHFYIADDVQFKFDRCLRNLAEPVNDLPTFGVGHSLGSPIHLLIGSRYAVQRSGNVLMAFNNKEASLAIPLFSLVIVPMAQSFGPILSQLTSSPTIRFGAKDNWALDAVDELPPDLLRIKRRISKLVVSKPPLTGMDTVLCWHGRRIQPLSHRGGRLLCTFTGPNDSMRVTKSGMSEKVFKKRINHLVKSRTQYKESLEMFTAENPPPELTSLTKDQLVSEAEKATLHARWLETTKNRKRKKTATEKDCVQVEGVPVVTSTLSPVALKLEKKKRKTVVHREKPPKESPAVAPTTPVPPKAEEYSIPPKGEDYPLPSQRESSQPGASKPDARERADNVNAAGTSFVPDENVPSFDEKFKVLSDGLDHMGITFQEYSKEFSEMLRSLQRMSKQTFENINREVMDKLSVKNKEIRALCKITEEKESELCTLRQKLDEQESLLAEAMKVAEDAGNAPKLREENLALHKENVKIQKLLEESRKALEDSEARSMVQKDKVASVIKDLETGLRDRLKEVEEIDKHLFSEESASTRIERIKILGEFIEALKVSGRKLVEKIIPDRQAHYSDLIQLPNALDIVIAQYDVWMRSAARGGVRMALGLMQMHYTTAESWRLATVIPTEYTEPERTNIFDSVKGWATKIARMVSVSTFYPEAEIPTTPEEPEDDDEEGSEE